MPEININDPKHAEAQKVKTEVAQLNAHAVVKKLRRFEERLGAQDQLIAALHAKLNTLEARLNVQLSLEAMASKMGNGPTT
jgi:tRNA U34 5-methylaminomethyl-2-thiouridine-forming methyltransferase MnmC